MMRTIFTSHFHARPLKRRARVLGRGLPVVLAVMVSGLVASAGPSPAAVENTAARQLTTTQVRAVIHWHEVTPPARSAQAATGIRPLATCSGNGCNNTDPVATGCADGSQYTAASGDITYNGHVYGTINLRYSPTCGTNWAQVINDTPGPAYIYVCVDAPGGACSDVYSSTASEAYSNQVYAPDVLATAHAGIDLGVATALGSATG